MEALVILVLTVLVLAQSAVIFGLLNRLLLHAGTRPLEIPKLPSKSEPVLQPERKPLFKVPVQI